MPAVRVPVTGAVVAWAIAEAGLTVQQAAKLIQIDAHELIDWINGQASPSKGQFDRLCKALGRSESFFFLARPPSSAATTASFRNPPGKRDYAPNSDDLQQIRQAENVQQVARWLASQASFKFNPVRATTNDSVEDVGQRTRQWLSWSTYAQLQAGEFELARLLRSQLEAQGIVALNLSLGDHGLRGFCLPDPSAPVIAINTKDDTRARLFTYLHECAHLSLGSQYLCGENPNSVVERWCERVAAAVLMPLPDLRDYLRREKIQNVTTYEQVRKAANKFSVSLRAMAIRLEQTNLALPGLYEFVDKSASAKPRQGFGRGPAQTRARRRIQSHGAGYVSKLLDAARAGDIRDTDVLDLLKISRKDYGELGEILAEAVEG